MALFVLIYGFGVLDVTNDSWLLTGRDLQQHYVGWKYFRSAPWTFPIGCHSQLTEPYYVSVLYTDSIPLFALICKALSPILPATFQYFGLFGLMCFVLNGGFASLLLAKFSRSKVFCALGSVFFILSTPVLQRLFGLVTENSRHTSLAAHFLVLGALGIWLWKEKFLSVKTAAIAYSILGILCVLIQMYMIFIVGGIMCGYLLENILEKKDVKRCIIVLGSFLLSSLFMFWMIGGFTDVLAPGSEGFGKYSANLNTFINGYHYSLFTDGMSMEYGQYEGFAYLGMGMITLVISGIGLTIARIIQSKNKKNRIKIAWKSKRNSIISVGIVILVFAVLAITTKVYFGRRLLVDIPLSKKVEEYLAIIRSSGRFVWVIFYIIMLFALFVIAKEIKKKTWQIGIVSLALILQIVDLSKPIGNIHKQYAEGIPQDNTMVESSFWTDGSLEAYQHIVYFPTNGYNLLSMLQTGTKASNYGLAMNNFYLSRLLKEEAMKADDKDLEKKFATGQLDEKTIYIVDYKKAHQYRKNCFLYEVDNKIIASKNPIDGLQKYQDPWIGEESPEASFLFCYDGQGRKMVHRGFNGSQYKETGLWTTKESVVRVLSGGATKARITLDYVCGKKEGQTTVKMNGEVVASFENSKSGSVEFDVNLRPNTDLEKKENVNYLVLQTKALFTSTYQENKIKCGVYLTGMKIRALTE